MYSRAARYLLRLTHGDNVNVFRRKKRSFHDVDEPRHKVSHKEIAGSDQEQALIVRYQQGDRGAGAILLEAHGGFIRNMAKRGRLRGLEDDDLLQEAKYGFLDATLRYDRSRGTKLVTWAAYWMRHAVDIACENTGHLVRIPVKVLRKLRSARHEYRKNEMIGVVTADEAMAVLEGGNGRAAANALARPISLDAPWSDDTEESFVEAVASPTPTPEELYERADGDQRATELLAVLTPRERDIIESRILREEAETFEGIGVRHQVSRERVRQVEAIAITKLRRAARARANLEDTEARRRSA